MIDRQATGAGVELLEQQLHHPAHANGAGPHSPPHDDSRHAGEEVAALKAHFLASLNHEIRTPLSGIFGMTDLLMETGLNEEQREYVAATRACAESLLQLLNATLDYSALVAGGIKIDATEFNLEETIEAALAEYLIAAKSKGLRVFRTFSENLPETVVGDAARFRKMLAQLIENAVKFTAEGNVEIRVENSPADGKANLKISVVDTGMGIAPEQVDKIFEAFRQVEDGLTRTKSGLGLGLSIALKLATLMGGRISVTSQLGWGSRFEIHIPMRIPSESKN